VNVQTAYLFPGQGSQFVGMGQALYQAHPEAQAVFAQAEADLGISLTQLCFEGPQEALNDTLNTQPAILTLSVAAWEVMRARGAYPSPAFVAGHSMGEFSALVAAGALPFGEALHLVRERGRLMKRTGEQNPGGMAAVLGLDVEKLALACDEASQESGALVQIANDNCPGQTVISGHKAALDLAVEKAQAAGARTVRVLPISIASHSPLMAVIVDEFAAAVDAAPIADAAIPLIANASAAPITRADDIRAELKAQLTSPVRWTDGMRYLVDQGVTQVVEIGPKEVLCGLMKRIERKVKRISVGNAALDS
jgi:[acyl-carrier-protein] S-malonyltransferase